MINQVNNGVPLAAPAGQVLAQILGDDALRIRIQAELIEVSDQLALPNALANDPRVQSITLWHDSFLKVLRSPDQRRYPNPREVLNQFVEELERTLRGPGEPEAPFPPELFGDRPIPIFRFMVRKMRDPHSLFYSERFDQEAIRILAEAGGIVQNQVPRIPAAPPNDVYQRLIQQLRQIEADRARRIQAEAQLVGRPQAFLERMNQRVVNLQGNIDRVAQNNIVDGQRIRDDIERLRLADLEQRNIMIEAAERMRREAEGLRADAGRLQRQLDAAGGQLGELERANIQLQVEINQLGADIKDKKSNWLAQAVSVVASIVVSYILEMPVTITV